MDNIIYTDDLINEKAEKMFENITCNLIKNGYHTETFSKAYKFARRLHGKTKRKDGTPVIFHPLNVATILAENGFSEDIVSAGILHDTIEDCSYTYEQMKSDFTEYIANAVYAVTETDYKTFNAREKSNENLHIDERFEKKSLDEDTYMNFIKKAKKLPLAFYIKFADRIHNLSTIGSFERHKQLEKVKETEQWILPVSKILNSSFFYGELKNLCFKIEYNEIIKSFQYVYNDYCQCTKTNFDKVLELFTKNLNSENVTIKYSLASENEIFNLMKDKFSQKQIDNILEYQMSAIPIYNIFVIENTNHEVENQFNFLFNTSWGTKLKPVGLGNGISGLDLPLTMSYITVSDDSNVLYNIYHVTQNEYLSNYIGTTSNISIIDELHTHDIPTEYIYVKTANGETISLPLGSTVLDFAFSINENLGLSFLYAIVTPGDAISSNTTKQKADTKLKGGDIVTIFANKNEDGELVPCPEIKWFAYINTATAKEKLIKYFENIYDTK